MQKMDWEEERWDKKKIIVAIVVLVALLIALYAGKVLVLDRNRQSKASTAQPAEKSQSSVRGETAQNEESVSNQTFSPPNIGQEVQNKITQIQREIQNLDVKEIASSSPQVQKILKDINSLEQYPANQLKDICLKICNGF